MMVLDEHVARRRQIHAMYKRELEKLPGIMLLDNPSDEFNSNHWLTCIVINPERAGFTREELRLEMEQENIETRPLWKPMHLQPVFANAPYYGDNTCKRLFDNGLCIPSGSNLTNNDVMRVIEVVKGVSTTRSL